MSDHDHHYGKNAIRYLLRTIKGKEVERIKIAMKEAVESFKLPRQADNTRNGICDYVHWALRDPSGENDKTLDCFYACMRVWKHAWKEVQPVSHLPYWWDLDNREVRVLFCSKVIEDLDYFLAGTMNFSYDD